MVTTEVQPAKRVEYFLKGLLLKRPFYLSDVSTLGRLQPGFGSTRSNIQFIPFNTGWTERLLWRWNGL